MCIEPVLQELFPKYVSDNDNTNKTMMMMIIIIIIIDSLQKTAILGT
jgi:hypothetical protein